MTENSIRINESFCDLNSERKPGSTKTYNKKGVIVWKKYLVVQFTIPAPS